MNELAAGTDTATPHTTVSRSESPGSERSREVCRPYTADNGRLEAVAAADRSQACADIVGLYRSLQATAAGTDDFELLQAEFNRVCAADPRGVLRALQQEVLTA